MDASPKKKRQKKLPRPTIVSAVERVQTSHSASDLTSVPLRQEFVFLDIDGVINFGDEPHADSHPIPDALNPYNHLLVMWIDRKPLAALDAFLDARPNALVVVSSSWRRLLDVQHFQAQFSLAGLKNAGRIIAKTSQVRMSGGPRGEEIESWLESNGHAGKPFVALDDCVGSCSVASFATITKHLILIDPTCGFTRKDAVKAATALDSQHQQNPAPSLK